MSRIRSVNTTPELAVRSKLHAEGLRFRVSYQTPGGKVDIAFPKLKIAIQIDGCFWHNCPLHGAKPKTNIKFWRRKLSDNQERDARQNRILKTSGWQVLRFWEHEVEEKPETVIRRIRKVIKTAGKSTIRKD